MSIEGSTNVNARIFRVEFVSDQILKTLCQALWNREDFSPCGNSENCVLHNYPWVRLLALMLFVRVHNRTTFYGLPKTLRDAACIKTPRGLSQHY